MAKKGKIAKKSEKDKKLHSTSLNPFERKNQKQHFTIYGQKKKGTEQKSGQLRDKAFETVRPQSMIWDWSGS